MIGFSDITSLHNAILSKTGLISYHGPVGKSDWNTFTKMSFEEVLIRKNKAIYELPEEQDDAFIINSGKQKEEYVGVTFLF